MVANLGDDIASGAAKSAGGLVGKVSLAIALFFITLIGIYMLREPLSKLYEVISIIDELQENDSTKEARLIKIETTLGDLGAVGANETRSLANDAALSEMQLEIIALKTFEADAQGRLSRAETSIKSLEKAAVEQRERALTRIGEHKARDVKDNEHDTRLRTLEGDRQRELIQRIDELKARVRELEAKP